MSESTAVVQNAPPEKMKVALARFRDSIAPLMRRGEDVDRLLTLTLMSVANDPKLAQCTPASIATAASRIAGWGLEPGVTAHLVPFKNTQKDCYEVTAIADYKGLIQLMVECGARDVDPQVVLEGDTFEYGHGLNPFLEHRPGAKRGKITHAYCIVTLAHNVKKFEVMTVGEIDALRMRYSKIQGKAKDSLDWYCRKTVVRRVAKYVPMHGEKGARLAAATQQDAEVDIPDAEVTPLSGDVRPIAEHLPRRAPTHASITSNVSRAQEEFTGEVEDHGEAWEPPAEAVSAPVQPAPAASAATAFLSEKQLKLAESLLASSVWSDAERAEFREDFVHTRSGARTAFDYLLKETKARKEAKKPESQRPIPGDDADFQDDADLDA